MYVKIIQEKEPDHQGVIGYEENVFECTTYTYRETEHETIFCIIHGEDNATTFPLEDRPGTKIFIMNNDGVTIDSYRWKADCSLR
jgi:hypothetical protein